MNSRLFLCLALLLSSLGLRAQGHCTTDNPRIDDVNDRDVIIKRVELTDQYTIIYMKFESAEQPRSRGFNIPLPGGRMFESPSTSNIGFVPTARLYVNQGERSYKFIKAENIPSEMRRQVQPGERVDFVAYFERIAPGYTVFDLYECKDGNGTICFNFWGVHIINPKKQPSYSQRRPSAPVQPRTTVPPATPRVTPVPKPTPKVTPAPVPPAETPAPTAVAINGTTRDAKTQSPIGAMVTYRLLSGAEAAPADSVQSAGLTGTYSIPVPRKGVYVLTASARGYFSKSDTLATNRVNVTRDFNLTPIVVGTKVTLNNIYFNASKYDLQPASYPELDRLTSMMQENPTMHIRLEGHTDTVGDFDENVKLSRNRVNEVKRYLVSKGIADSRIETVGYGPSRPINKNKSLLERPENRRVEMVIVKV